MRGFSTIGKSDAKVMILFGVTMDDPLSVAVWCVENWIVVILLF